MRAAILESRKKLVVREVTKPVLDRDEVLIRVKYCGICGSDLHVYMEGLRTSLGHEYSGDIVEMGADVRGLEIGDPVVVEPRGCGECYWCQRGEIGLCDMLYLSKTRGKVGAFATYVKANHYDQILKLTDGLTHEQGAIIEPTSIALHAVNMSGMKLGDVVVVLGLGPIGQLIARLAKLSTKAVYAAEISQTRIELAKNVVDEVINPVATDPVDVILERTDGMGADIVFECAGKVETTQEAIALTRKRGTIIIPGMCFEAVETSFLDVVLKELTIKGSLNKNREDFISAYNLIKNRRISVDPLLTERFPLEEINSAFEKALKGEGGKILIRP